ncbi:MAG: hypothetical protein GY950_32655 [bacterium]|nr:hypothetical protein [bacterium]
MKIMLRVLIIAITAAFLAIVSGCGPAAVDKPKTEPIVKEPSIEELRKPVAKDPAIYKAVKVLQKSGRLSKKYMSYEKYQKLSGGQGAALDPDWFYDSYVLDLNENGYWASVTFGTAKRAIERDPRIEKVLTGLPAKSIFMKLKTPSGRTYILSDAEADGILDFARDEKQKTVKKIDIPLLDKMQEKYTWIIGIVKRYYKK